MRKLSQIELLDEGALRFMGDVLKAGGSALGKKISPSLYGDVSKIKSGAKKLYKKHFNSPTKFIESWAEQYPEIISNISNIQTVNKGTQENPLHVASFTAQLRDPATNNPFDEQIPLKNIPIKEIRDKDGNTNYKVTGNQKELDQLIKNTSAKYPNVGDAIQEFGREVLRSTEEGKKAPNKTPRSQEKPPPLPDTDVPPPLPDTEEPQPEEETPAEEPQVKKEKSADKKNVIRRVRRALNSGKQLSRSDLDALRTAGVNLKDRITFKDPKTGEEVSRELRALLGRKNLREYIESMNSDIIIEKSQKSLLKHLQSISR